MIPSLLLVFSLIAQDNPPEKCVLSGTITDFTTGAPLRRAEVFLESLENPHASFATANTDAKGNFSLVGLDPGKYRIKGVRNGYLDTYYGARRGESQGTTVVLEAGQELRDLQVKLLPYAVIAGTIRDAEGEPVAAAKVRVRRLLYYSGRRELDNADEIMTDDLGQYRAANLVPGKYYVEAEPRRAFEPMVPPTDHSSKDSRPREVLLPAYYPGVRDAVAARPIDVAPGARVIGIDIPLTRSRVYQVSGHIALPPGVTDASIGPADVSLLDRIAWTDAVKGDFNIREVPPGNYVFDAAANTPNGSWNAAIPVTVSDADVTGLSLSLAPNPEVSGLIVIEGENKVTLSNSFMSFGTARGASIHGDGSFHLSLKPGHYAVGLFSSALRKDLIVKAIRMAQTDLLRDGLTLNAGGNVRIEVVLAPDGGQIEGSALDKDEKPVAGATVVAVPELALRTRPDRFYQASTDQYGRYKFENVAPGDYKVFAWNDVEPGAWFDPEFFRDIESHSEVVKLQAKGHETARVHLPEAR